MTRTDYFQDPNAPTPNSIKVAASALVLDGHGRILMIHKTDNNLYSIPGGGLETGETVSEAVIREVNVPASYNDCDGCGHDRSERSEDR
ncbi:8-oxo-dGTP pyrophosphatase MutT (NUDIX family) [Nocardia sp. GAS34]|uniref:NUDIX hydrolase n=1 Tax=unclassified Nocardia TaxID=2637762 RepID=UPI003D1FC7CA